MIIASGDSSKWSSFSPPRVFTVRLSVFTLSDAEVRLL